MFYLIHQMNINYLLFASILAAMARAKKAKIQNFIVIRNQTGKNWQILPLFKGFLIRVNQILRSNCFHEYWIILSCFCLNFPHEFTRICVTHLFDTDNFAYKCEIFLIFNSLVVNYIVEIMVKAIIFLATILAIAVTAFGCPGETAPGCQCDIYGGKYCFLTPMN